jgi:LEA14-like dessication related protein
MQETINMLTYRFTHSYAILLALLLCVGLMGCGKAPYDFKIEGLKVEKVELKATTLRLNCSAANPNGHGLTVRDLSVKLLVEGVHVGTVDNIERIKLRRKRKSEFDALVRIEHLQLVKALPFALLKKDLSIEAQGTYQVKLLLAPVKFHNSQFITVNIRAELYKLLLDTLKKIQAN